MAATSSGLTAEWSALWSPPERLPLGQWAERNFVLSPEYSAKTGGLELYSWQREPLDAFTDPRVSTLVLKCGTQLLKTLLIQVAVAYVIAEEPGPVLLAEPNDDDARAFSKERLAPMQRDLPCLRGKLSENVRDSKNTITYKQFPGGALAVVGVQVPGNVARRSIRYFFADEVDKYPTSAGKEGDPLSLGDERTTTYRTRAKRVRCCSPTVKGRSRISDEYERSDQRKPYVPCPECGHFQVLKWAQVKWNNKAPLIDRPASARYECEACGARWTDAQRVAACEKTEWRASKPFRGVAGFLISHLHSPWKSLADIVRDFLDKKDKREQLKTFINTTLAEEWEEAGETPDWELLFARREDYSFGAEPGRPNGEAVCPAGVLILTCAVDVQDDRLEYEVAGWGRNRERWSIAYGVIRKQGNDGEWLGGSHPVLWEELDKVLAMEWAHESGGTLSILAMAIDTGSRPKPVYDFARRHNQPVFGKFGARVTPRSVVPIKGSSNSREIKIIAGVSQDDAARKRGGVRIVSVGTGVAKQAIYDALRLPRWSGSGPAPVGYRHFPQYEESYFTGVCSEKRVVHDNGTVTWEKMGRNEPLDVMVYNDAMAELIGIPRFQDHHWDAWEQALGVTREEPKPVSQPVARPVAVRPVFRGFRMG